jgi:hypothetical protein
MDALTVFIAEVSLSLVLSLTIVARLRAFLRRIGGDVCEREGVATEFWIAYMQLMMLIAPLLLVGWFSRAGQIYNGSAEQLKSSLTIVLFGQFAGLVLVGRAVWNSFVRKPATPPVAQPVVAAAAS